MSAPCSINVGWDTPCDSKSERGIKGNRSKKHPISDAIFSLLVFSLTVHISGSGYADEGSAVVLGIGDGGRLELATDKARRQSRLERWDCAVDVVG